MVPMMWGLARRCVTCHCGPRASVFFPCLAFSLSLPTVLWMGRKAVRVLLQVRRGREHRSQAGGAKASVRTPRPLFLLALNTAQPDPDCWGWQVPHLLLVGVHVGSERSLGVVWASRRRQSGLAGKESGSDGHGHTRACPQSTPMCWQAACCRAHWGTGRREHSGSFYAWQLCEKGIAFTLANVGLKIGELTKVSKYQGLSNRPPIINPDAKLLTSRFRKDRSRGSGWTHALEFLISQFALGDEMKQLYFHHTPSPRAGPQMISNYYRNL